MDQSDVAALARHALTAGAGALVSNGIITGSQAQDIVAGLMAISAVAWSLYQKRTQRAALVTAAVTGTVQKVGS